MSHTSGVLESVSLRVEWITRLEEVDRLREPWMRLEAEVQNRTVYSTFDYVLSWYHKYGGPASYQYGRPLVGLAWEGEKLVGIAPMAERNATFGKVPLRRIDWAGTNLQAGELLVQDGRRDVAARLIDSLLGRAGWDVIVVFGDASSEQDLQWLKTSAAQRKMRTMDFGAQSYAVGHLENGYEGYWAAQSQNFRRSQKRIAKKVEEAGVWRMERLNCAEGKAAEDQAFGRLAEIAVRGWRVKIAGEAVERRHHGFYRELVRRFAPRGMIDLSFLTIDGNDVAFTLAILERQIYWQVLVAYNEKYEECSPGTFLLQQVFRALPEAGIRRVVSHGGYEYKKRRASEIVAETSVCVFSKTLRASLSHLMRSRLLPLVERVRGPYLHQHKHPKGHGG